MKARVVVIETDQSIRPFVADALAGHDNFDLAGQATTVSEGLQLVRALRPDVVVASAPADLNLPILCLTKAPAFAAHEREALYAQLYEALAFGERRAA